MSPSAKLIDNKSRPDNIAKTTTFMPSKILPLSAWLLCSTVQLLASDEIALVLKVQSDFPAFQDRFERRLRNAFRAQPQFDLMEDQFLLGNHPFALRLELSYPLKVFSGEAGCMVKIKGLPQGDRSIYYHHRSNLNGDLSLEQSQRLAEQISQDLCEVLPIECGLSKGEKLKDGPYENKRPLNLAEPLQVELLGSQNLKWQKMALSDLEQQEKQKNTSLLEEQRQELNPPDLEAPMPESRREALAHQQIIKKLDQTWSGAERAKLYRQLSALYERHGLTSDARRYAQEALREDQSPESMAVVHRLEGLESRPLDRFRRANLDRKLMILFQNEWRYDSNAVLEEVDNLAPTNSDDWILSNGLHLEKEWLWHLGEVVPSTSYHIRNDKYTRNKELDLLNQRVGQEFSWSSPLWSGMQNMRLGVGYNSYLKRGHSIMQGLDVQLGESWMKSPQDIFSLTLSWQDRVYAERFYSKAERDGDATRLEGSWRKKFQEDQILWARTGVLKDSVGDPTLSYRATTADLSYEATSPWKWLGVLTGRFGYERRWYEEPEVGRNFERQDAKFEYGVESRVHPFEAHTFRMGYLHTDGQSTRRVSFYRREQVFFGYDISF